MNSFDLRKHTRPALIISDVHGSTHWKTFVRQRRPGEHVVFLGDYFDRRGNGPFGPTDAQNFAEICAYARHDPDVFLLVGNHDYDYLPFARWQPEPWGRREQENRDALMANIDLMAMVHIDGRIIFSHGGLTQSFLANQGLNDPSQINEFWMLHPEKFDFQERDPNSGQWSDRYGDDPWQSPIWARTTALASDAIKGFDQVVGHTPVLAPEIMTTFNGDQVLLTCTLDDTLIRIGGKE